MRKAGLVILLVLTACEGPGLTDKQRNEAGVIAGNVAVDMIDDSSRVSDLEARIEELESKERYN